MRSSLYQNNQPRANYPFNHRPRPGSSGGGGRGGGGAKNNHGRGGGIGMGSQRVAVPKPIQTCSLKAESGVFDLTTVLVPAAVKEKGTWGGGGGQQAKALTTTAINTSKSGKDHSSSCDSQVTTMKGDSNTSLYTNTAMPSSELLMTSTTTRSAPVVDFPQQKLTLTAIMSEEVERAAEIKGERPTVVSAAANSDYNNINGIGKDDDAANLEVMNFVHGPTSTAAAKTSNRVIPVRLVSSPDNAEPAIPPPPVLDLVSPDLFPLLTSSMTEKGKGRQQQPLLESNGALRGAVAMFEKDFKPEQQQQSQDGKLALDTIATATSTFPLVSSVSAPPAPDAAIIPSVAPPPPSAPPRVFETPSPDEADTAEERERRRRALALEQQRLILQQVEATRRAAAQKKMKSTTSQQHQQQQQHQSRSVNVIARRNVQPEKNDDRQQQHPEVGKPGSAVSSAASPSPPKVTRKGPRTKGRLFTRLADGTLVESKSDNDDNNNNAVIKATNTTDVVEDKSVTTKTEQSGGGQWPRGQQVKELTPSSSPSVQNNKNKTTNNNKSSNRQAAIGAASNNKNNPRRPKKQQVAAADG